MNESLALYRQVDDATGLAEALDGLGDVTWLQGDFERSRSFYEESLSIRRSLGDSLRVGLSLYSMARLYIDNHKTAPAAEMLREAFELFEKCKDRRGLALTMKTQGRLEVFEERYADAKLHLQHALLIFDELGNLVEAADCIEELALVFGAEDRLVYAAQLCGAAGGLREVTGVPAHREHHAFLHNLRTQLDETVFTAAWAEGRALTQAQAVKLALSSA
jgi:tetratricopeptide (TPR) repeat protein